MANVWDKFDGNIDVEALKGDIANAAEGILEFKEVPEGRYEVSIEKMELKESKTGKPMLSVWLKVITGEYEGSIIFYNQVLHTGYGIHNANEFLRSLDSGVDVTFDSFKQYNSLISDVHEAIDGNLEYDLEYGKNKKGFSTYKIVDIFES